MKLSSKLSLNSYIAKIAINNLLSRLAKSLQSIFKKCTRYLDSNRPMSLTRTLNQETSNLSSLGVVLAVGTASFRVETLSFQILLAHLEMEPDLKKTTATEDGGTY